MFSSSAYGQQTDFTGFWQNFTVISYAGLTNTGPSVVAGNVALFPNPSFTGFPPGMVVNGTVYSAPNPIFEQIAQRARTDAQSVYNTIVGTNYGGTIDLTGLNLGDMNGGNALTPGVYSFASSADLTGTLELQTTAPGQTFIFKIGSTLDVAALSNVVITGAGANCTHVFWQVGSSATFLAGSAFQGNVFADISVTFVTGAQLVNGRAFALNGAVVLDTNNLDAGLHENCEPGGSSGIAFTSLYSLISPDELTAIFQMGFSAAGAQN